MRCSRAMVATAAAAMLGGPAVAQVYDAEFSYTDEDRRFGIGIGYQDDDYYGDGYYGDEYYVGARYYDDDVDVRGDVRIEEFFEGLAPHGEWSHRRPYGWVWSPRNVDPDWRPYTQGHWTYTDYGWTWVSHEPWGWATSHYGRWYYDPVYGWAWVPGTRWAPAWVAWRSGPDYIGWAPLPPQVPWRAGIGLDIGRVDLDVVIAPVAWSFVRERSFLDPRVHTHIVAPSYNTTFLRRYPVSAHYTYVGDRVINRGVPISRIERVVGRRIARTPIRVVESVPRGTVTRFDGGTLQIYKPRITIDRSRDRRTVRRGDAYDRDVRSRSRTIERDRAPSRRIEQRRTEPTRSRVETDPRRRGPQMRTRETPQGARPAKDQTEVRRRQVTRTRADQIEESRRERLQQQGDQRGRATREDRERAAEQQRKRVQKQREKDRGRDPD